MQVYSLNLSTEKIYLVTSTIQVQSHSVKTLKPSAQNNQYPSLLQYMPVSNTIFLRSRPSYYFRSDRNESVREVAMLKVTTSY